MPKRLRNHSSLKRDSSSASPGALGRVRILILPLCLDLKNLGRCPRRAWAAS